jgi:hypothetical protein
MKIAPFLAIVAGVAMTPPLPVAAAKENKLPRCTGKHPRPANPYGTVLPTIPDRGLTPVAPASRPGVPRGTPGPHGAAPAPSAPSPTTNLFPPASATPSPQGPTSSNERVPAIGASPTASAALPTSYASC